MWDALSAGHTPLDDRDPEFLAAIRHVEVTAKVPEVAPDLAARTWEKLTGGPLPLVPLVANIAPSVNGRRAMPASAILASHRVSRRAATLAALFRMIAIGTMAGMGGGFVAGLWTRVAMRIAGALTVARNRGLLTDNDEVVGRITLNGTLFLGFFAALMGVAGGLLYVLVRRRLPGNTWQRPLLFGSLLLLIFGFVVMDEGNPDYRRFGSPWLNVATFSIAYLVFGLVAGMLADWLDRWIPRASGSGMPRWKAVANMFVLSPFALVGLMAVLMAVSSFGLPGPAVVVILLVIVIGQLSGRLNAFFPRPGVVRYALIALPSLIGVFLTVQAIAAILIG
jgi:MFS family permease